MLRNHGHSDTPLNIANFQDPERGKNGKTEHLEEQWPNVLPQNQVPLDRQYMAYFGPQYDHQLETQYLANLEQLRTLSAMMQSPDDPQLKPTFMPSPGMYQSELGNTMSFNELPTDTKHPHAARPFQTGPMLHPADLHALQLTWAHSQQPSSFQGFGGDEFIPYSTYPASPYIISAPETDHITSPMNQQTLKYEAASSGKNLAKERESEPDATVETSRSSSNKNTVHSESVAGELRAPALGHAGMETGRSELSDVYPRNRLKQQSHRQGRRARKEKHASVHFLRLVDLPLQCSWEDVQYSLYITTNEDISCTAVEKKFGPFPAEPCTARSTLTWCNLNKKIFNLRNCSTKNPVHLEVTVVEETVNGAEAIGAAELVVDQQTYQKATLVPIHSPGGNTMGYLEYTARSNRGTVPDDNECTIQSSRNMAPENEESSRLRSELFPSKGDVKQHKIALSPIRAPNATQNTQEAPVQRKEALGQTTQARKVQALRRRQSNASSGFMATILGRLQMMCTDVGDSLFGDDDQR
eukprot:Selendium_serpulae@DN9118_c0_g1_i1.p1